MELNFVKNRDDLTKFWPINSFIEAYNKHPKADSALKGCSLVALSTDAGDPDKTAIINLRLFIENSERAKNNQKYILGLKFYNFGNLATLDLISLNENYHQEIAGKHLTMLDFPMLSEYSNKLVKNFQDDTLAPILFAGGHLKINSEKRIEFLGSNKYYENSMFFTDSNSIGEFIVRACKLGRCDNAFSYGKDFIGRILEFMLVHKSQPEFYEQFIQYVMRYFLDPSIFNAQQLNAFLMMKAVDRFCNEDKSPTEIMVEELTGGFRRNLTLNVFSENIKRALN